MGRIIIPGDPEDSPSSYADESYEDDIRKSAVTVLAQFPSSADLTWYAELLHQMKRREVKYRHFRKAQNSLPPSLVRRVLQGLRPAIVAISDDTVHKAFIQPQLEAIAKKPLTQLDGPIRRHLEKVIADFADEMTLFQSPLFRVEDFLGHGDAEMIRKYVRKLKSPRNIRVFALRNLGAFVELVDPRIGARQIESMRRDLFFADDALEVALLHQAGIPARVFDEGNTLATDQIRSLRDRVNRTLRDEHYLIAPTDSGLVSEASSTLVAGVGASDIASGYGKELYLKSDGRRRVAEAFDLVFLNGVVLKP